MNNFSIGMVLTAGLAACFWLMLILWKAIGIDYAGNILSYSIYIQIVVTGISVLCLLLVPEKVLKEGTDLIFTHKKFFRFEQVNLGAMIGALVFLEFYSTFIVLAALSFSYYYLLDSRLRYMYPKPD